MGVATPVSGFDTIKRAETRVADTDTYKGRVQKLPQDEMGPDPSARTNTWGGGKKDNVSYTRTHTSATLPNRGARKGFDSNMMPDEDRRRSAEDLLENNGQERGQRQGKVPLVNRDELMRYYSPGSSDALRTEPAQHEIKRSLKDDLNLQHEQGEGGFVRESIRRNEGFIAKQTVRNDLESAPPEITTKTMIIDNDRDPKVYRQNRAPEVETHSFLIGRNDGQPGVKQGTQDGGTVITRTIMMGGAEPTRTETIRQTTMPTEIIQKTITIEGDGNQLTAEELKDIIAKHAGDIGSSEVVTTTYTTKVQEVKQTKTITETMRVVDDEGNIIKTGDPDTDAAIWEAIQRAKEENPNAKITEVVITRTDEESQA